MDAHGANSRVLTGSRGKAFMWSSLSGLAGPAGAALAGAVLLPFLSHTVLGAMLCVGAGLMVYISLDELLPASRAYGHEHLSIAEESGRPVMIDFVLPNCAGCRQLEKNVFSRADVAAEAGRFIALRVDLSAPPAPVDKLKAEYGIFGAPSVVWIDGTQNVRHDLTVADGGVAPEEFLRRMRRVE